MKKVHNSSIRTRLRENLFIQYIVLDFCLVDAEPSAYKHTHENFGLWLRHIAPSDFQPDLSPPWTCVRNYMFSFADQFNDVYLGEFIYKCTVFVYFVH